MYAFKLFHNFRLSPWVPQFDIRSSRELALGYVRNNGGPQFFIAILQGHTDRALELLKYGLHDVNATDHERSSALQYAAVYGDVRLVDRLIELGAEFDTEDRKFRSPISEAAQREHWHVVERLLRAGAYPNMRDQHGKPLLAISVGKLHKNSMEMLLRAGADPRMPLLLLQAGADSRMPRFDGSTVIDYAYKCTAYGGEENASEYHAIAYRLERQPIVVPLVILCLREIHYSRNKPTIPEWFPPPLLEWPDPEEYLLSEPPRATGEKRKREEAAEA